MLSVNFDCVVTHTSVFAVRDGKEIKNYSAVEGGLVANQERSLKLEYYAANKYLFAGPDLTLFILNRLMVVLSFTNLNLTLFKLAMVKTISRQTPWICTAMEK